MSEKLLRHMNVRGLDENIIDFIKNSDKARGLREIINSINMGNKEELFMGIRNNFITVYYRCLVVMEIRFNQDVIKNGYKPTSKNNKFNKPKITKEYLKHTCLKDGDISSELICMNGIKRIKEGIEKYIDRPDKKSEKTEKKYQQNIVIVNNSRETKSKWICFDVEYTMADESFGRYDILAISTVPNGDGKYSIGFIEVKVDKGSYGTNKEDIKELLNNKNVLEVSRGKYKVELKSEDSEYLQARTANIMEKIPEIDEKLNQAAAGWKTKRMGKVELTILRLALYEMLHDDAIPEKVSINEAVELAKKFGGNDSPSFVNGILAKFVVKGARAAAEAKAPEENKVCGETQEHRETQASQEPQEIQASQEPQEIPENKESEA